MKDKVNLLIRKLLHYYFPNRVQVFYKRYVVSEEMMLHGSGRGLKSEVESALKYGLVDELFRKGIIDVQVRENLETMTTEFTGRIYVLK